MLPDAAVVAVDVIAAALVTGLLADGSPPAAEAIASRFANSPVPVLSNITKTMTAA